MSATTEPVNETTAPESDDTAARRQRRRGSHPFAGGFGPLRSGGRALSRLPDQVRRILGFGLMRASAPLRDRSGEPIRARARLESAQIEERYRYSQEISLNAAVREAGQPTGLIKLVLPYDGDKYFTRQACRDVAAARNDSAAPDDKAIVGFLALTAYEKTGLESPLRLQENFGSVPIEVDLPAPPDPGEVDQLLVDGSACVISQAYDPQTPRIIPVQIEIELDDPDTVAASGETRAPERQADFEPDLWLGLTVRLHLPRSQTADAAAKVSAKVSKVFMSWPTHTALSSLTLSAPGKPPLRYNPEEEHEGRKGGLEWSDVPMELVGAESPAEEADAADSSDDEIVTLSSGRMTVSISKPGDLYKQERIGGRVEVTVNRLLSGMDGRLYDATGKRCHAQRPELKLKSIITTEFSLPLYDAFERRMMSPYQWLYFEGVIPSEMRIDDIKMALRNRGFRQVKRHGGPENCTILATRVHGPDQLLLHLYVKGEQYTARRQRNVPGGVRYRSDVPSGDLRIYAYGTLRGESRPVVHEINALRRALRERFDRLQDGR